MKLFFLLLFLPSCAHSPPQEWWPSSHWKTMSECRAMCRGDVYSYNAYDGECVCQKKK